MKNQKGFTLIELLLVLAIIGIISAIAIPALLSQRSRARDKAAINNMTGRLGDLIGQVDRLKEGGNANSTIAGLLNTYLTDTSKNDKNPWDNQAPAFAATAINGQTNDGSLTMSAAAGLAAARATVQGQPVFTVVFPNAAAPAGGTASAPVPATPAGAGYLAGAVKLNGQVNGTSTFTKVSALE